jgi:UDP-glucose 4-epimerase
MFGGPSSKWSRPTPSAFVTGDLSLPGWAHDASGRTIAVLGADGFIGNRVALSAVEAGAQVVAICTKEPWRLAGVEHERLAIEAVRGGSWWSREALTRLSNRLKGLDAAIFLYYHPPVGTTAAGRLKEEMDINAATAGLVARAAAAAGSRLVYASTANVYGQWYDHPVAEESVLRPTSSYAQAKLEAERLIAEACDSSGYTCLRLATVYGPGENGPRAIPSFIRAFILGSVPVVHGNGSDTHDYVHVDDVAAALVNAAVDSRIKGVLNVGSGVGRTTLEVLAAVAATLNASPSARHVPSPRPPARLILDPRRAEQTLGLRSRPDFAGEIRKEARWLTEHLLVRR